MVPPRPEQPLRLCLDCQLPVDCHQDSQDGLLNGFPNPSRLDLREPSACRQTAPSGHARWVYFITEQVYEDNPSLDPQCGGTMQVVTVMERPAVVWQILEHLALPTAEPSLRAPPDQPNGRVAAHSWDWSYGPLFEDLPVREPVNV